MAPVRRFWQALVLTMCAQGALHAQGADVVRGRVLDDSSRVLPGAIVSITRGPDRLVQQVVTDSTGRYSSRFDPGTGDYLVHVSMPGFRAARRRVERVADERELVADFTLQRDLAVLDAVRVTANQPTRAQAQVATPYAREVGASEQWNQGAEGRVSPNAAGNLSAIAATMPGVTMTPSGPSMLGADPSSNLTTLNGMALPGGSLPRAARADVRVTGATFDATRGGFAGANIDVRLGAGDRNYQNRNAYLTLNAPQLQMTDAVGRSLGLLNGGFRASVGADGEAIRRALTYNIALDVGRTASDPTTLLGSDGEALRRAGLSPDSARRVQSVASALGLPLAGTGVPSSRVQDNLTFLGRLDDVRDTLRTLTLTTYAGLNREGALGFGPLSAPGTAGKQTQQTIGAQLLQSQYVGKGYFTLMQNRIAASRVREQVNPYLDLPGATVLVRSASDASASDIVPVSLGGNPFMATNDTRWTAEAANEMVWNAQGRKHRFKTSAWIRGDGLTQEGRPNALGQYTFMSLADLAANRPASYNRTLSQPAREASAYNAALAFSHQWNPNRWFSTLAGARLEGNRFGDTPLENVALEQALGVRTGVAPSRLHVSPRAGFSYTYSRSRENGNGQMNNGAGSWYRNTMGIIRGGIGEFRDLYRPGMLADAMVNAGLAGSTIALSCVGSAVPVPTGSARRRFGVPADVLRGWFRCPGRTCPRGFAGRSLVRRAAQLAGFPGLGRGDEGISPAPRWFVVVRPVAAQYTRRELLRCEPFHAGAGRRSTHVCHPLQHRCGVGCGVAARIAHQSRIRAGVVAHERSARLRSSAHDHAAAGGVQGTPRSCARDVLGLVHHPAGASAVPRQRWWQFR